MMLKKLLHGRLLKNKLWRVMLLLLFASNLGFFLLPPFGWLVTLGFFCFVPGYLVLRRMHHTLRSGWEVVVFSLGISILFLMLVGLALNSLHYAGLTAPLTTLNSFVALDAATLLLIFISRKQAMPDVHITFRPKHIAGMFALLTLPLLAAGGAIQLNNGVQSVLPLIIFATISVIFLVLVWRKGTARFYPYALFIFALSVLFTVSLRGDGVTGHDVQREFYVFELAMSHEFWNMSAFIDPYNACLSITILPVLIAKITGIADAYIFKVVFQIIFAFSIIPIYFFMKRLHSARTAFMGSFLFIAFPTFLNDMPMLNRQEIGLLFFSLLMLLVLTDLPKKQKKVLTVLFLLGAILAHYSSGYIILGLLFMSWLIYVLISKIYKNSTKEKLTIIFPTLNLVIISTGLLFTFLWNFQITGTTAGLEKTASKTFQGIFNKSGAQSTDVGYSLIGGRGESPQELLDDFIRESPKGALPIKHVPSDSMPLTPLGESLHKIMNVEAINGFIRSASAKFIQVMLLLGIIIMLFSYRKRQLNQQETYFLALIITCIALMILQIILPQLSVDYGTLRLFQQLLIILAIPVVIGMGALFFTLKRFAPRATSVVLAFLFLHLSGFIPQLTGGYPPQLALNNAGFYYDSYYIDNGEKHAANWLVDHNPEHVGVAMDPYAQLRINADARRLMSITSPFSSSTKALIYKDRMNKTSDSYMINLNSNLYYYRVDRSHARESCWYSNPTGEVCKLSRSEK